MSVTNRSNIVICQDIAAIHWEVNAQGWTVKSNQWRADNLQDFIPPKHCSSWFHSLVKVSLSLKSPHQNLK